ncbi:MAG: hypothetical protein OJF55_001592 [Rhodanobacteraceae bacterium]|nr:MAG: hypothetical protein OJF55_001592 [Rhodanobacteraceae bacterium]
MVHCATLAQAASQGPRLVPSIFVRRPRAGGDPVTLSCSPKTLDSRLRGNDESL